MRRKGSQLLYSSYKMERIKSTNWGWQTRMNLGPSMLLSPWINLRAACFSQGWGQRGRMLERQRMKTCYMESISYNSGHLWRRRHQAVPSASGAGPEVAGNRLCQQWRRSARYGVRMKNEQFLLHFSLSDPVTISLVTDSNPELYREKAIQEMNLLLSHTGTIESQHSHLSLNCPVWEAASVLKSCTNSYLGIHWEGLTYKF